MQIRSVECVDLNGMHNTQCDPSTRPNSVQSCAVGIPCMDDVQSTTETEVDENPSSEKSNADDDRDRDNIDRNFDDITGEDESDGGEDEGENTQQQKPPRIIEKSDEDETEEDEEMQSDDPTERNRNIPFGLQYRMPRAERYTDPNMPNEPT